MLGISPEVRLIPLEVGIRGRPEDCHLNATAIGRFVTRQNPADHVTPGLKQTIFQRPGVRLVQTLYGETVGEARLVGKEVKIPFQVQGSQLGAVNVFSRKEIRRIPGDTCMKHNWCEHCCRLFPEDSCGFQFVAHCFEHPGRWNCGIGAQGV